MKSINSIICSHYNIKEERFAEKTRKREVVTAKQVSVYFHYIFVPISTPDLAWLFYQDKKRHDLILYCHRAVKNRMTVEPGFLKEIQELTLLVKQEGYSEINRKKFTYKKVYL